MIKTESDVVEYLTTKSIGDLGVEISNLQFEIEEAKKIIRLLEKYNCVILGLSILKKDSVSNEMELWFAWWNYEAGAGSNFVKESSSQSLDYLDSSFINDSDDDLYVEITFEESSLFRDSHLI